MVGSRRFESGFLGPSEFPVREVYGGDPLINEAILQEY